MSDSRQWQRLPLLALCFFFLSTIRLMMKHLYQAAPALAAAFIAVSALRPFIPHILLGLLVLIMITTVLRYRRFFYATETQRICVKQGVLRKVELNLEYDRIQQADIARPFYFRPFQLAILKLQSAGSKAQEVEIAGLRVDRAVAIQAEILAEIEDDKGAGATQAQDSEASSGVDFTFTLPPSEVLRIGLMQNIFVVVGVITALLFSNQQVNARVREQFVTFVEQFPSTGEAIFAIVAISLGVLVLLILGTIAIQFNKYYGYTLTRRGDRVRYEAGLTSTLTRSFRVQKLQLLDIRQGWMGRLLNRQQIRISQAGNQQKQDGKFVLPCVSPKIRREFNQDLRLPQANWQPVHWLMFPRFVLLFSGLGWLLFDWRVAAGVLVGLTIVRWRWWHMFAWHFDGEWLAIRHGFIGSRQQWMPAAKLQHVSITQGPIQRRFKLSNLQVSTAAGNLYLPYLKTATAERLQQQLLDVTRDNYKRWM
ncbi:PH domain-containing protein [Aliidiomarina indica]|uniref:PH domain-containing protein n=1 Tax=Aliidiomarina indica TaxID=2749147 RepID=UPI00188FBC51|nr:PH domain-containing protein [Aliidiomarina indica]